MDEKKQLDPKKDIESIDQDLKIAQENHTQVAEELGRQRNIIQIIKPFWNGVTLNSDSPPVGASGAMMIHDWKIAAEDWRGKSELINNQILGFATTAANVAYSAVPISDALGCPRINLEDIKPIVERINEMKFVEDELRKIDSDLADTYRTAFAYINLPALDPTRGPLLLMRQVFDHFFDKLASDEKVSEQPGFVADPSVRNHLGVNRIHRQEFLSSKISDTNKRKVITDSTQNFLDIYQ